MDRAPEPTPTSWRSHRSIAPLLLGLGLGLAGSVHALGIDSPLTQSALGQALNLAFPILLRPGEKLTADCVQSEVFVGEARLPPHQVQLVLEGESEGSVRAVRLYSPLPVNEPLVHVNLSLGCPVQLQRQFTAFIDPPGLDQGARGIAFASVRAPQYTPAMRAALAAADARPGSLLASPKGSVAAAGSPAPRASLSAATALSPTPSKPAAAPAQLALVAQAAPPKLAAPFRSVSLKTSGTEGRRASDGARLRLDAPDAEEAADSPLAQMAAAEVALLRLRQLEEMLNRLQQDNQGSRAKVQALRGQLEAAPVDDGPQPALIGLAGLSLALAGLSAFLWYSRRKERLERDAAWWAGGRLNSDENPAAEGRLPEAQAKVEGHAGAAPLAPRPLVGQTLDADGARTSALPGVAVQQSTPDERTMTLPVLDSAEPLGDPGDDFMSAPMPLADEAPSEPLSIQLLDTPSNFVNDTGAFTAPLPLNVIAAGTDQVTVEELIDLEQQVEFFLVLGQSDAAVELLQARVDFGGASALPYLKLMEIHQRQGDEARFHQVAAAFGKRFAALAPTWGADLNLGRDLEDYAADLKRLQGRWKDAAASMALVQDLLSKGGEQGQGFDLPAYRELLFLYGVARDLSEHEMRGEEIDLFLPLDSDGKPAEGQELMATMIWQGKAMPGPQHALEVDISLDDPNAAASRITAPGRF